MGRLMYGSDDISDSSAAAVEYEAAVCLNRLTLKAIGVWPEKSEDKTFEHRALIIFTTMACLLVPQIVALCMVINQLPLVIDNMFQSVVVMTSSTKILLLWFNKKKLRTVLSSIKHDYFKEKDEWEREIMLTLAKRGRFFTLCGYAMMVTATVSGTLGPAAGLNFRVINNITDIGNRYLPIQSYYPFEYWKFPYYETMYLHQVIVSFFSGMGLTSPVTFFSTLIFHSCGQIMIIGIKVEKMLKMSNNINVEMKDSHINFVHRLKDIVDSHTHTIRIVAKIEDSFKNLILVQIIGLTIMLCCLGFQLVNAINMSDSSSPTSQLAILSMALMTILMHTFAYCFAGESLSLYCDEMYRRIFETDWYSWHPKYAMALILLMIRSKDPLQLTAGKFLNLNLRAFSGILKSTAGYVSMLMAVRDK